MGGGDSSKGEIAVNSMLKEMGKTEKSPNQDSKQPETEQLNRALKWLKCS